MEAEQDRRDDSDDLTQNPSSTQIEKIPLALKESCINTHQSQDFEDNQQTLHMPDIKSESGIADMHLNRIYDKENSRKFQIQKKWEWLPCNYELKREEKDIETYWSLTPIIQLVNSDSKSIPQSEILIDLERPFMYNPEVGWNWHKSWNLPNVSVNMKIIDPKTKTPVLPPVDLKAQLLAVRVLLNRVEQVKLFDLGLKGSNIEDISDGSCTFSGVKFSSTSYNNDGVKFHLVVLIYIQEDSRNRACPKILYSKISPPIFVDSRKAARNSQLFKFHSIYFELFPPDTFTKVFVKRNSKSNEAKEEMIENNLAGLCQYFTAPNIRNKVKHPLFLAAKFSNCVKYYCNFELVKQFSGKEEMNEEDLIYTMHKALLDNHTSKKTKSEFAAPQNKAFDNKYFILVIEEANNPESFILNKKIADYLEPLINDIVHIIYNSNLLPSNFTIVPTDNLITAYTSIYPKLVELKESYGPLEEDDDEYEESTFTSQYKSYSGSRGGINSKRDKFSDIDYDDEEEDIDDEDDEEESEVASVAKPNKKLKISQGSLLTQISRPKRTATNIKDLTKQDESIKTSMNKPKEKFNLQKNLKKKQDSDKINESGSQTNDIKTETDDLVLKSEPQGVISNFDRYSSKDSLEVEKDYKRKNKSTLNLPNKLNHQRTNFQDGFEKLSNNTADIDFTTSMQNQQAHPRMDSTSNQLFMNFMYQPNLGMMNPLLSTNYNDLMSGSGLLNPNLAILQQQQQQQNYLQAQLASQLQQQKQQQQMWQVQQHLRYMQDKAEKNLEKQKAMQVELGDIAQKMNYNAEFNPMDYSSINKSLNSQAYSNFLLKGQPYMDNTGGVPNSYIAQRSAIQNNSESYSPTMYPGLQQLAQMDSKARELYLSSDNKDKRTEKFIGKNVK